MLSSVSHPDIVSLCASPDVLQENIKFFTGYKLQFFSKKSAVSSERHSLDLIEGMAWIPATMICHPCRKQMHRVFYITS